MRYILYVGEGMEYAKFVYIMKASGILLFYLMVYNHYSKIKFC